MKQYLYYPETGVYLGEYVADDVPTVCSSPVVPHRTTLIAPPEGGRGHLLFFDAVAQCWEVHTHQEQEQEEGNQELTGFVGPMQKKFQCYSGSLLIFIGLLLWFAALCDGNNDISALCGLSLIFGTAAYISFKERMVDPTKNSTLRKGLEWSAMLFIFLGYIRELSTSGTIGSSTLLNSITPVTTIVLYGYCLIPLPKRSGWNQVPVSTAAGHDSGDR